MGGMDIRLAQRVPASSTSCKLMIELGRSANLNLSSTATKSSAVRRTVLLAIPWEAQ